MGQKKNLGAKKHNARILSLTFIKPTKSQLQLSPK